MGVGELSHLGQHLGLDGGVAFGAVGAKGVDDLQHQLADTHDLPVIMITSRSTQKHRDQAALAGVTRFVTKPYSEVALLKDVQELIRA